MVMNMQLTKELLKTGFRNDLHRYRSAHTKKVYHGKRCESCMVRRNNRYFYRDSTQMFWCTKCHAQYKTILDNKEIEKYVN